MVLIKSFFFDYQEVNTPICYIVNVKVQFFCTAIGLKRITCRSTKRGLHSIALATRQSGHNKTFIDGSTRESISYPEPSSSWPRNEGLWHNPLSFPQIVEIRCFCACTKLFSMEDMELMNKFHDSINNALLRLGKAEISLKEAQFEALKAIVMERKNSLVILSTGYGKSLIYQTLPFIFDYLDASSTANMIIAVSPLNALMQEQVEKLSRIAFSAEIM